MNGATKTDAAIPPLYHGDRMPIEEFRRRRDAMPGKQKIELLDGMVYLQYDTGRILNRNIPPLENGDHLPIDEFERRWENMPDLKKVELLDGVVFMPPPVSVTQHGFPHSNVMYWLVAYQVATPGVQTSDNGTFRAGRTESQPDAMLVTLPEFGGNISFDARGCLLGTPRLAAEISFSSLNYDLHTKFELYERLGIPEYLVWRTSDKAIDWFALQAGRYVRLEPDAEGIIKSQVYPGLWLDWAGLVRGDLKTVARILQRGTETPEHLAFVENLASAAK